MAPRSTSHARRAAVVGVCFALTTASAPAAAEDAAAIEQARDAYDQGVAAYARNEFAQAADYFARADELVPSEEALEAALDSATRADEPALAMRLADRAERSVSPGKGLADAAHAARLHFRARTGRVVVRCQSACSPSLDGRPIVAGVPTWTLVGPHSVVAVHGQAKSASEVLVTPERLVEVTLTLPIEARRGPEQADRDVAPARVAPAGVPSTWVWIGAGASALLGGAAALSGLDTLDRKDEFAGAGCEARGSAQCDLLEEDGRSARLRTNLLLGGAAATTVATVALAAFFVDWRPRSARANATLGVGPGSVVFTRAW